MADIPMPNEVIAWMADRGWGRHHLRWHMVRIWDRLGPEGRAWAEQQGWSRYPIQEGEETNGLSFLAMHRVMIRMLTTQFPAHAGLFDGWTTPPTDPNDTNDPVPPNSQVGGPFDPNMAAAIQRIETGLASFDGDDAFGQFVETSWRPFPNMPTRRSNDSSTGIHNYLHGRFARGSQDMDMGDPEVNINNQRFWRLHGWIERKWIDYRAAAGRTENDPRYREALEEAEQHMAQVAPMALTKIAETKTPANVTRMVSSALFEAP